MTMRNFTLEANFGAINRHMGKALYKDCKPKGSIEKGKWCAAKMLVTLILYCV